MRPPLHADGSQMQRAHGLWWPNGGWQYGARYINHADDMQRALRLVHSKRRRTVIQAGGHVGVWPLWLAERFDLVITLEQDNYRALVRNLEDHDAGQSVIAIKAALGAESGSARIKFNQSNIGGHKISPKGDQEIAVLTIDGYGVDRPIDLIVLDVEGYEYAALTGARETLKKWSPVVMLEDRDHAKRHEGMGDFRAIETFLAELGYVERDRVAKDVIFSCDRK